MGRSPRIDLPGCWYHVTARGQRREPLFLDEWDYRRYLTEINAATCRCGGWLGAYCLMPNHVHLLIQRLDFPLAKLVQIAHTRYSSYFNMKHEKKGHVFQGRYGAKLVLNNKYLARLLIYIHRNPVRSGIVKESGNYQWSSFKFYNEVRTSDMERLKQVPGFEGREGRKKHRELIRLGLPAPTGFKDYVGEPGEEVVIERRKEGRIGRLFKDRRSPADILKRLEELCREDEIKLESLKRSGRPHKLSRKRQRIMVKLYRDGFSPYEIAKQFKLTPASIYRALERIDDKSMISVSALNPDL